MPIYTYKCKKCGKVFEKFKNMSANGTESCEECHTEAVRVFTPSSIIFKGSGFYTTDYKSGSNKANLNTGKNFEDKKEGNKEEASQTDKVKETPSKPIEKKEKVVDESHKKASS